MANAIHHEIAADIEALAGDMEGIKDLAEAMGRPELFEAFQKRYQAASTKKERLTELQTLITACMPTSDALMNQQMIKSGDARLQLLGHMNQRKTDAAKAKSDTAATEEAPPKTTATPKKSGPATLQEKFLRNPVEKVIAAMTGIYPGYHRYKPAPGTDIKTEARQHLLARQGNTEGVKLLLSITEALAQNKELLRQFNPLKAFIKGKTWQLSAKGLDMQQALEVGDPKALKARTLVTATRAPVQPPNSVISSCR